MRYNLVDLLAGRVTVMREHVQKIDELLSRNELKKAEVIIAKQLKSEIPLEVRFQLLLRRARIRLLSARVEDALSDLQTIQSLGISEFISPQVLELQADCYFARFELASVGFSDRNDIALAQHYYEQIIRDFPRYANLGWVYYQLGRSWVTVNEIEKAVKCFQQALLTPSHISALTAYCYERLAFIAFYEHRDLEQAMGFLNRSIDTYPSAADRSWLIQVHLLRSRVLRGMKDYEKALEAAQTALSLVPNTPDNKMVLSEVLLTLGELLAEAKNRDRDVVSILQQFIQITRTPLGVDVTWSRVNEMLGNAYFNLGQYDNAVAAYQAALQFNPDHPWGLSIYYLIARSYYHQQDYSAAIRTINRMFEIAKAEEQPLNDYRLYDMLGNSHFALGQYEDAVEAYQTALRIAPLNAESLDKIKSFCEMARERL